MKVGKATRPASLNGIEFDALITESRSYEADIPDYPTEDGFNVSDSILRRPFILDVTAFISDTPVTWKNRFGSTKNRTKKVLAMLEDLYFNGSIVTFTTSDKVYKNMGITSLTIPKTKENGLGVEVTFQLKQIRVTKAKTTTIPASYGKSGKTGASGGTASTSSGSGSSSSSSSKDSESQKASSILYGMVIGGGR
jgi:hypothetical protein